MNWNKTPNTTIAQAGYTMEVSSRRVLISANEPCGLFYGMQTLMQLLPPDIESRTVVSSGKWEIPCVSIMDYPRFEWRGLMLDASNYFRSKEFTKKYIDELAKYKFNVFHWHLTDHLGWRIEIEGLPKLTEVGAWRVPRSGDKSLEYGPRPGEKATYGGYYTHQDIREIVDYANKRFVTIVPEIDVPGHSRALVASYPSLSCTQVPLGVNFDNPNWRKDDTELCPSRDSTWQILEIIFTQVAELFPGEYIHVGGDEVHTSHWKTHTMDQALMKREGLTSVEELQGYFEKRLEKMIVSKGKKMIAWWYPPSNQEELPPDSNYAFMSWKYFPASAIEGIKLGHRTVSNAHEYTYLEYSEKSLPITKCYGFEPVPEGVNEKDILGGHACIWGLPNDREVENKTWPRAMALSEVYWSQKNKRNWDDFAPRMISRLKYLDVAQVKYSLAAFDPVVSIVRDGDDNGESNTVKITTLPGLDAYYRFDDTDPDSFSPKYAGNPLSIPDGATEIRVVTYYEGKPVVGRQFVTLTVGK